jgi:hypothetical protein
VARNAWFRFAILATAVAACGHGGQGQDPKAVAMVRSDMAPVVASLGATAKLRGPAVDSVHPGRPADSLNQRKPADSLNQADREAVADSVQRAREIEVMRETFAYAGGARDPFASLINSAKTGPEISDLDLVGVYLDLRTPSNNIVVLRERLTSKRHKMRVGDQLGRARLTQIRPRDAVFMIQDFGFERQETLSLRKQEVETP